MHSDIRELVGRIHAAGRPFVLAATGGGATAAAWLLAVPGASGTVLEVAVPYAGEALDHYLGSAPPSYCSAETAQRMAERARERAAWLAPAKEVIGVSATASLRSDRPKKGDHRIHAATATALGTVSYSLTLAKGQRDREGEEEVASRLVLTALAEAVGLADAAPLPLLPGEQVSRQQAAPGVLAQFLAGTIPAVCVEPDGRLRTAPPPGLVLPGSFNPLHHGHVELAATAARRVGRPAVFELTVVNADKPPLGEPELRRRLRQFHHLAPVWLTRAPTFAEKARLFGGAVFVVGADTAARIVQPRFYGDSAAAMAAALDEVRRRGCRFLVAGRAADQDFVTARQLAIPDECRDLFEEVPEAEFRCDVSSTELRARGR